MGPGARRDEEDRRGDLSRFRPGGQHDLAPPGDRATGKAQANLAAMRVLRDLEASKRPPTGADQAVLGRWAGWGALPGVFDDDDRWGSERVELRSLIDNDAWAAARRTTLNAHYTDARVVGAVWDTVTRSGFTGGAVLEPGCGAGNFIGLAPNPSRNRFVGVELDPTTGRIAQALTRSDMNACSNSAIAPRI